VDRRDAYTGASTEGTRYKLTTCGEGHDGTQRYGLAVLVHEKAES
jgi:hypothetical protein